MKYMNNRTNLFSVKSDTNLFKLLKNFNSSIVVVYVFKVSCEISQKHYETFVGMSKYMHKIIFALINVDDFITDKYLSYPDLSFYRNNTLLAKHKCLMNDDISFIVKQTCNKLINNMKQPNSYEKTKNNSADKITKIIELDNILNKLYMEELNKLSMMKEIHRKIE